MKKLLALLLALLCILPLIVACQDTPGDSSATTNGESGSPEATTDPFDDHVPEYDFEEREFFIMAPGGWGNTYFDREEMTDETINDAIYTRNRLLENRFNITIRSENHGSTGTQASAFQTFKVSGEDRVDMIAVATYQSGKPMITEGLVLPWNDIPHINLDRAWWNKSVTQTLAVLGNYYYLSGDINYAYMNNTMCMFFNKEVAEVHKTIVDNPYETVLEHKWTFDHFLNIVKNLTTDDGNGVWDENDTYGHLQYYHSMETWVYGANYQTVVMNKDKPIMNIYTPKMTEIVNFVYDLIYTNKYSYLEGAKDGGQETLKNIFFDNRALFYTTTLGSASGFRSYETDFGILPNPKYDEKQKEYKTYSDQWGLVCALPSTATNLKRTGAILEAMCAQSMKLVRVAVYDKTLIGKGIRDDESEEMLNILFAGVLYDTGITFISSLDNIPLRGLMNMKSKGLSSWWRGKEKVMTQNYKELFDYVKAVKEGTA